MALPQSSPAVDAGSAFGLATDQRGETRPFDLTAVPNSGAAGADGSDIGAFELHASQSAAAPDCNGVAPTIVGTSAGETIVGTTGPDVIRARGGDDFIKGRGGKDLICADDGNDKVRSGKGKDEVLGSNGDDRLRGGGGGDRLIGGNDNDRIFGQAGNDSMFGGTLESTQGPSGGPSAVINRCSGGKGTDEATGCDVVKGVP